MLPNYENRLLNSLIFTMRQALSCQASQISFSPQFQTKSSPFSADCTIQNHAKMYSSANLTFTIDTRARSWHFCLVRMQRVLRKVLSLHLDIALILVITEFAVSFLLYCITATAERIFVALGCLQSMAHIERFGADWIAEVISTRSERHFLLFSLVEGLE